MRVPVRRVDIKLIAQEVPSLSGVSGSWPNIREPELVNSIVLIILGPEARR